MKPVNLTCPKCGHSFLFKNYFHWIWNSPIHWLFLDIETNRPFDFRKTKCPHCNEKSYMRRL